MKEAEAAAVIQKWFRRHSKKNVIKSSSGNKNFNNLHDDEKLQAKNVLEEVNLFYRKFNSNLKKKEEIRKLCANIDEVSSNLRGITKLEQCKELETSFSNSVAMERIEERHREQIRQIRLKWWEKLDICEKV